jgi:hypothetical protein
MSNTLPLDVKLTSLVFGILPVAFVTVVPVPNCIVPPLIVVVPFHPLFALNFKDPTPAFVKFFPVITPLIPSFSPPPLVTLVPVFVILILPYCAALYLLVAVIVDKILKPIELKLIAPAAPSYAVPFVFTVPLVFNVPATLA